MSRSKIHAALVLVALVAAGCRSTPKTPPPVTGADVPRGISVSEVAARLGLSVTSSNERGAVLSDPKNTVSIFPDPRGRVFVNGRPVGESGGIVAARGILHVPPAVLADIHRAMVPPSGADLVPPPVAHRPPPKPPVAPNAARLGVVVVDPGHGGEDSGTPKKSTRRVRGNGLIDEKAVNLDTSLRLERHLKKGGARVVMTRRRDVTLQLGDRPVFGNRYRPRLFVSIHADAAENRSAHGFTIYVARRASAASLRAAEQVRRELVRTGVKDRGIRRMDFRVLKNSAGPAMLVELGFLSNAAEARRLATSRHRETMAAAVARGVLAFLKSR